MWILQAMLVAAVVQAETSHVGRVGAILHDIEMAIAYYRGQTGRLPAEASWVEDLVSEPGTRELMLSLGEMPGGPGMGPGKPLGPPIDTWGFPIVYRLLDVNAYEVYSVGCNGIDEGGLGDDVTLHRPWTLLDWVQVATVIVVGIVVVFGMTKLTRAALHRLHR